MTDLMLLSSIWLTFSALLIVTMLVIDSLPEEGGKLRTIFKWIVTDGEKKCS